MQFQDHGLSGGLWTGRITGLPDARPVHVLSYGQPVAEASLTADGSSAWAMRAELPGSVLSDGVHTLILAARNDAAAEGLQVLARLHLMAGTPLEHDLLAEMAQLRAELDLLKREFRRAEAGR